MSEIDKQHSELLVFHQQTIEDIRFTKTQIWNTTYLTILAIGGLICIFRSKPNSDSAVNRTVIPVITEH